MPQAWRAPGRPDHKITQCYNDGFVHVYSVTDEARPGFQPIERLTEKVALKYEERRAGIQRHYEARQNQIRVERVVRVQHAGGVTSQDVVVDEHGRSYRVDLVQFVPDVYPQSDDLTLVAYRQEVQP